MTYAGIGSRETPKEVLDVMTKAAEYLDGLGYTLRSGAADGADTAFEKGATKKEIFKGFDPAGETEVKIAHEIHPDLKGAMEASKNKKIKAKLAEGATKQEAEKSGERSAWAVQNLMARNTNQVFGKNLDSTSDFVLFYAKETDNPLRPKGGTGQAVEMARRKGIPTINMADANWREQLDTALSSQPAQLTVNKTKQELKLPEYTVDKNLRNKDGSIKYGSTDGSKITINPVSDANKFFEYFEGKEGGPSSIQKGQVLSELAKQGYTLDVIKSILNTNKLINTFLILHEQSHIDNNDKDVYWLNGKDRLTPDKIAIEVRATVDALEKLGGKPLQKSASEVRYKDKAKRIRIDYPAKIYVEELGDEFDTNKLLEIRSVFTGKEDGTTVDQRKFDKEYQKVLGGYGMTDAEYKYVLENQEIIEYLVLISDDLLDENEESLNLTTIEDVIDELLKRNEKLVDTAQLSLFDPNNEDVEGADEPNPCGII